MAKQLNVNLAFNADTGKAKAQIQELQNLLNKVAYTGATSTATGQMQQDLMKASTAAKELQYHLNNAFNATTGRFDLSMLDKSLRTSKSNISSLSTQLLGAGDTGKQAFLKLAQSIASADQPMLRISNRMREFGTVMKNTIKWQLSSSMIHGFMGAINSAYGYAQDLNKSLTDIRIVTGQNTEEMARFAEQANKAAKALSTTTTDYTKASLIYFQQGLNSKEVEERTQVTIKMANATGTSAQTVSDQMTAVWNNFDNGSKSLEYYADVMTALGAATASSTDEISQGLQKFAAVSQTVGLSYEYATAALATITSNTRESADVVGTALKTLFARIQGLQLGETLEDGTNLNKYSQALAKVGISIYESNGELKAMDNILNEMAAKWETLNTAQQTALAQTVAGVRQYTQLVALMENWNNGDGDSFQANLQTISGAEGTLDEQAEIYAQSWEAAEKRVRASAEGIYQSLLDDKFFISLNNGFANLLSGIDAFIDGLGGVKPLITGIASIFMTNFAHKIPQALENLKYNLQMVFTPKAAEKSYANIQTQMKTSADKAFKEYNIKETSSLGFGIKSSIEVTDAKTRLAKVNDQLSESEKQAAQASLGLIEAYQQEIMTIKQKNEELQNSINLQLQSAKSVDQTDVIYEDGRTKGKEFAQGKDFSALGITSVSDTVGDLNRQINEQIIGNLQKASQEMESFSSGATRSFSLLSGESNSFGASMNALREKIANLNDIDSLNNIKDKLLSFIEVLPEGIRNSEAFKKALSQFEGADTVDKIKAAFENLYKTMDNVTLSTGQVKRTMKEINPSTNIDQIAEGMNNVSTNAENANVKVTMLKNMLNDFQPQHVVRVSEALGSLAGMAGSVAMALRSVTSIVKAFTSPDMSGWERALTLLTGISMIVPGIMSIFRGLSTVITFMNQQMAATGVVSKSAAIGLQAEAAAAQMSAVSRQILLRHLTKEQMQKALSIALSAKAAGASQKEVAAKILEYLTSQKIVTGKAAEIISRVLAKTAIDAETTSLWGLVAAMIASMGPVAIVIAAIVALTAIIWGVVAAYNAFTVSAEEAAERTAAASKRLEEAAKAAKEEAEGIKNAFDEYDTVIDTLNDCVKGTDEWYAALGNVKNKISEILEQYPDLAANKNLLKWDEETGTYLFDKNEMDSIIAAAENKADTMSYASQMGRGLSKRAQAEVDKKTYNQRTNLDAWDTDISNMTSDVTQNRIILETAARAEIEANPSLYTEDVEYYLSNWSDSIQAAAEAGASYAANIEEGGTIILNASRMAAENLLSKDDDGDGKPDENYDQAAVNAGAQAIQSEYDRIYDELYGKDGSDGLIGDQYHKQDNKKDIGTKGPDDVLTRYENAVGGDINWANNAIRGTDANREFVYIEDGQEKILTPEDIAATIAAYESTKNADIVESAAATVQTVIGQLQGNAQGLNAVTAITNGGSAANIATTYGNLTQEQLDAINTSFADGDISKEDVAASLGLTTEQLKTMLDTMEIDFTTFAANCQTAALNVSQSLTDAEKTMLSELGIDTSGMTIQQQKTYASNITNANTNLTNNDIAEDNTLISDIVSENANLDPAQVSDFIGEVSKLNLTSEDAASQIAELAEQYGIQGDSVQALIGEVEDLDQVYNISTKGIAETANTLKEIVGEGLKTGDKISEEDYAALEAAGINVGDYFSLMADGTYSLTGKAEEFNAIVNQITFDNLYKQYQDFGKVKQQVSENYNNDALDRLLLDTEYVHNGDHGISDVTGGGTTLTAGEGQLGKARLDYISGFEEGTFDFSSVEGATELLAAYKANPEMTFTAEQLQVIANMIDVTNAKSQEMQIQMLSTANSLSSFNDIAAQIGSMPLEVYSAGLINLASQYENCTTEISAYQNAVLGGDAATIKAAESTLRASIMAGEAAENYGLNADAIEFQAAQYQELYAEQNLSVEAATELAIRNQRMNKGLEKLVKNWDNYKKALDKNNKGTAEYAENAAELTDIIGELVGAGEDFELPPSFFDSADNMELIEKAAKGDIKAINALGVAVAKAGIEMIEWNESMTHLDSNGNVVQFDSSSFETYKNTVLAGMDTLQNAVANGSVAMGTSLSDIMGAETAASFIDGLNQMAMATNMTVDQMKAKLSEMGIQADVTTAEKTLTRRVPIYTTKTLHKGTEYTEGGLPLETIETYTYQTGTKEVEETVEVAQINMGDAAGTPPTFTGRGNVSSGNKGSKGGGGGGGSKSSPKKKSDSDKERYHTITNQLEDLRAEYEAIGKAKDKAFGTDKLKAMDAEINKTDELIAKQEEYIDAISDNVDTDKAIMEAYYKDVIGDNVPIEFDEKGNISNYDDIQDAMFNKYNSMASSNTEDSEAWKVFEEKYKKVEEYIKQYEESYDLLREEEAAYQELINQRMDLELEKIQYAVELKINIAEDSLALLEHQLDNIEDDAFKAADAIRLLGEKTELLYDEMEANKKGLMDILQQQGMNFADMESILAGDMTSLDGKIFTENQIDAIKEYRDNLLDLNAQMEEVRKSVEEKVMETFDAWHEKLETGVDTLDHYESVLSSYKNMVDIVGKDALGISDGFMDSLGAATMSNAIDQVKAAKAAQAAIENAKMTAQAAYDAAVEKGDEASKKMWEETLNNLNEEAQSAQEDMLSAWEDALSTLADLFSEKVERIVDNFNKSVYAFGGLDGLGDDFSRQQENADMILDDYEKMYELSKLNRDISKTIDETDNIAGKQKLKKLQEQINDLQEEGVEMSEYDLEYLQKTYDLRLAELELEEARNAKNTVRLSKDNEGNWSYVYTQNTDAVDAAQQKYEDALYAMQDLSKNYIDEMSEKLVSTYQEMIDQMANLKIEDFATTEEYYAELERIQKVYQEQYNKQSAEMQKAIDNNQALYEEDIEKYSSFVKDEMNLIVAYKDTILGQLTDSESEAVDFNSMLEPAVEAMLGGLKGAAETYFANLNATMEAAGTSTDSFSEDIQENITAIKTASEEATESVATVAEGMKLAFDGMSAIVTAWQDEYHDSVAQILKDNLALIESFNAMIAKLSEGTGVSQQNLKIMDSFNEMMQKLAGDKDGTVEITYKTTGENPEDAAGYDTGGYTGSWGKSGKMAMLHEKELVLNADDTSNFLAALKITRTLLDTIDLNAKQASLGLGQLTASTIKDEKSQILEQQVTITAEFPNVNDHNEIEEALNSLVNRASQYANRK